VLAAKRRWQESSQSSDSGEDDDPRKRQVRQEREKKRRAEQRAPPGGSPSREKGSAADVLGPLRQDSAGNVGPQASPQSAQDAGGEEKSDGEDKSEEQHGKSKGKAFAWMDSEDESEGADDKAPSVRASPQKDSDKESDQDETFAYKSIEQVQTFSEFVRVTPHLMRVAGEMTAAQLMELVRTAHRVKYFDPALFEQVFASLLKRFPAGDCDAEQGTAILEGLKELNAYNEPVFTAACSAFETRITSLNKEQRLRWISVLEATGHRVLPTFAALLRGAPVAEDTPVMMSSSGRLPCRHFFRGFCSMGRNCTFAHEEGLTPPPMRSVTVQTQTQQETAWQNSISTSLPAPGRSDFEPVGFQHGVSRPGALPACRHHLRGFCAMGGKCPFPHVGPLGAERPGVTAQTKNPEAAVLLAQAAAALAKAAAARSAANAVAATGVPPPPPPGSRLAAAQAAAQVAQAQVARGCPGKGGGQSNRQPSLATRARVCIHYQAGSCQWGSQCYFLHAPQPGRQE